MSFGINDEIYLKTSGQIKYTSEFEFRVILAIILAVGSEQRTNSVLMPLGFDFLWKFDLN